jgi:hypothetical protein
MITVQFNPHPAYKGGMIAAVVNEEWVPVGDTDRLLLKRLNLLELPMGYYPNRDRSMALLGIATMITGGKILSPSPLQLPPDGEGGETLPPEPPGIVY